MCTTTTTTNNNNDDDNNNNNNNNYPYNQHHANYGMWCVTFVNIWI